MPIRHRFYYAWMCLFAWFILANVADAQSIFPWGNNSPRGPKTLAQWRNHVESDAPEDPNPRIITDRPHLAEATTTVGLGRIQVETGYAYSRDQEAGTTVRTHSVPEPLIRLGVFREWFELRLGYNYLMEDTQTTGARTTMTGSDDIYLGAKIALT